MRPTSPFRVANLDLAEDHYLMALSTVVASHHTLTRPITPDLSPVTEGREEDEDHDAPRVEPTLPYYAGSKRSSLDSNKDFGYSSADDTASTAASSIHGEADDTEITIKPSTISESRANHGAGSIEPIRSRHSIGSPTVEVTSKSYRAAPLTHVAEGVVASVSNTSEVSFAVHASKGAITSNSTEVNTPTTEHTEEEEEEEDYCSPISASFPMPPSPTSSSPTDRLTAHVASFSVMLQHHLTSVRSLKQSTTTTMVSVATTSNPRVASVCGQTTPPSLSDGVLSKEERIRRGRERGWRGERFCGKRYQMLCQRALMEV